MPSSSATDQESYLECTFCKKKHFGGAQECAYLKQLMPDHPSEVTGTLAKNKCWYKAMGNNNAFAKAGMRKVGFYPYNPKWVEEHAQVFKPAEAFSTSGDNAVIAQICNVNPEVTTLADARKVLTATRLLAEIRSNG